MADPATITTMASLVAAITSNPTPTSTLVDIASSLVSTALEPSSTISSNGTDTKFLSTYNTGTFLTSLWTNGAIAGAELVAWILLRRLIKAVYEPRTYIPPREEQAKPMGQHLLKPLWNIVTADPEDILHKNGVDPYVFVRFLRLLARALVPIWILSWIILFPLNAIGGKLAKGDPTIRQGLEEDKNALSMFTLENIESHARVKFWAHLCLAWTFNGWIMFLIWHEMKEWLVIRQKHLISKKHSRTAQASTILVTGIPKAYMDEGQLTKLFGILPGGVKRVWLMRDLVQLPDLWKRRLEACAHLETAQVQLIQAAHRRKEKIEKKIVKYQKKGKPVPDRLRQPANPPKEGEPQSAADRYVPRKHRPTMRVRPSWAPFNLTFLGIGKKVDAIDWAQNEISQLTKELNSGRDQLARDISMPGIDKEHFQPLSSAFIRFNQQIAAHMARQCLNYNEVHQMQNRYIEQSPENVLWRNMAIKSQYELYLRKLFSYLLTAGLIVAFAFPAGYASVMSRLLTQHMSLFKDEAMKSKVWVMIVKGLLTSILPPVLLAIILMLAPFLLRMLARVHRVSNTEVELDIMNRFFVFLLINRFLIVTIVSISNNTPNFLDWFKTHDFVKTLQETFTERLPEASNFFLILIMVQFTGTIFVLLQPISLIHYYIRVILGGGTPRKVYNSRYKMTYPDWGTEFPLVTIYFVIMMTYMIISPVINGLGACFSIMSYVVYKYLCLWVWEQKPQTDTGGAFFPKAVTHVFVGLYLQEICLALIFLANGEDCVPQFALMVLLFFVTLAVHYMLYRAYHPLIDSLPLSLSHLTHGAVHAQRCRPGEDCDEVSLDEKTEEKPSFDKGDDEAEAIGSECTTDESAGISVWPLRPFVSPFTSPTNPFAAPGEEGSTISRTTSTADWKDVHWCERTHQWKVNWNATVRSEKSPVASPTSTGKPSPVDSDIQSAERGLSGSAEGHNEDLEKTYFAKPGGPGVLRPTRDDANDPAAFFHPATKEQQPIIWLPQDEFGIGEEQMQANIAMGVLSTTRNAICDHQGRVKVTGPAPDFL